MPAGSVMGGIIVWARMNVLRRFKGSWGTLFSSEFLVLSSVIRGSRLISGASKCSNAEELKTNNFEHVRGSLLIADTSKCSHAA
jgi:hypothetical protein